ncbi:hypothetical protein MIND_00196000 [Mycena indigotica]|uniref:Uncharacterized protein n=1 Tax=Mycena indigotica TaxID=2126181 RepID=A0A8H6WEH3_9AGAR|nr:uncharacterized protein MIND_00196000 [Mycena indigotica]KAF7311853.1 hypothetical protein MIND_00196000 [Mycena indigotica]
MILLSHKWLQTIYSSCIAFNVSRILLSIASPYCVPETRLPKERSQTSTPHPAPSQQNTIKAVLLSTLFLTATTTTSALQTTKHRINNNHNMFASYSTRAVVPRNGFVPLGGRRVSVPDTSSPSSPSPARLRRNSVDVAKQVASTVAGLVTPTPMPYVEPLFGLRRPTLGAIPMEDLRPANYLPMPPREMLFPRTEQVALLKAVGLLDPEMDVRSAVIALDL